MAKSSTSHMNEHVHFSFRAMAGLVLQFCAKTEKQLFITFTQTENFLQILCGLVCLTYSFHMPWTLEGGSSIRRLPYFLI